MGRWTLRCDLPGESRRRAKTSLASGDAEPGSTATQSADLGATLVGTPNDAPCGRVRSRLRCDSRSRRLESARPRPHCEASGVRRANKTVSASPPSPMGPPPPRALPCRHGPPWLSDRRTSMQAEPTKTRASPMGPTATQSAGIDAHAPVAGRLDAIAPTPSHQQARGPMGPTATQSAGTYALSPSPMGPTATQNAGIDAHAPAARRSDATAPTPSQQQARGPMDRPQRRAQTLASRRQDVPTQPLRRRAISKLEVPSTDHNAERKPRRTRSAAGRSDAASRMSEAEPTASSRSHGPTASRAQTSAPR
jgi:hypothetical protein